ncbi:MAG: hypothetical protein F2587_03480, partial [Actinobacteria bacterium]|nr:hypothetical protein [Actinomycetota bacterium]
MEPITTNIRVVIDRSSAGYRARFAIAYLALFVLMGGDAVRYAIGWLGWGIVLGVLLVATLVGLFRLDWKAAFKRVPWPLTALLALMLIGSLWSNYSWISAGAASVQMATSVFAVYLATAFDWREILRLFGNTLRVIIYSSVVFELFAALVTRSPIEPFFPNYEGDHPPAVAFYWTQ